MCPTVIVLSGPKGLTAPGYGDVDQKPRAGLDVDRVHVLSADSLDAIAMASGAKARIAVYGHRMPPLATVSCQGGVCPVSCNRGPPHSSASLS